MVCVPCFIIPVLLYIWHRFIQPIMLKYWNPWEKKDAQGNVIKGGPEFPFQCRGGVCPFPGAAKKDGAIAGANESAVDKEATVTTTAPATVEDNKKEN